LRLGALEVLHDQVARNKTMGIESQSCKTKA
jgi:hypothetical protein